MGGLRHHAIALQTRSLRIGPEKPPDLRMCTCFAGRTRAPSEPRLYTANSVPMITRNQYQRRDWQPKNWRTRPLRASACKILGLASKQAARMEHLHSAARVHKGGKLHLEPKISLPPSDVTASASHELTSSSSGSPAASVALAPARPCRPRQAPAFRAGVFCMPS